MKKLLITLSLCLVCHVSAQSPVKNRRQRRRSRKESEVNEPAVPWKLGKDIMSDTATFRSAIYYLCGGIHRWIPARWMGQSHGSEPLLRQTYLRRS